MYLDAQNLLSEDQTLIGTNTDVVVSTNVIDFTAAGVSIGEPVDLLIQITTAQVGASSTTIFHIFTDSAEGFGTEVELVATPAIAVGTLVAGYQIPLNFVPQATDRYMRLKYTIGGANITAGAFTAGIVLDRQAGETATA